MSRSRVVSGSSSPTASPDDNTPRYRTGAVARMVRMPAATLRIWERRYRVADPATSPSGHRLYCAADVRRLALLKQLTDVGHAIGSIAAMGIDELRSVASTHVSAIAAPRTAAAPVPWRAVVVGSPLARRLQQPSIARRLRRPTQWIGPFDSLADAVAQRAAHPIDALVVHAPTLHPGFASDLQAALDALGAPRVAVLYAYGAQPVCDALADAGVQLLREPQSDRALAAALRDLFERAEPPPAPAHRPRMATPQVIAAAVPTRRYDDATLTDFAGLSTTIACECPRHVAEILMQLSHFEAYSAECAQRSPADAALHDYLRQVAGASRALFETALEQVAIQEGLMLAA